MSEQQSRYWQASMKQLV